MNPIITQLRMLRDDIEAALRLLEGPLAGLLEQDAGSRPVEPPPAPRIADKAPATATASDRSPRRQGALPPTTCARAECAATFTPKIRTQTYCSPDCQTASNRERQAARRAQRPVADELDDARPFHAAAHDSIGSDPSRLKPPRLPWEVQP